jgi:hypothetical protein
MEERALAEAGAFAAGSGLKPAADDFGALEQGYDLGKLSVGHLAELVTSLRPGA